VRSEFGTGARADRDAAPLSEDSIEQMLALAERLRAAGGGAIDEPTIQAVAEATGAPLDHVRLVLKLRAEKQHAGMLHSLRAQYFALDVDTRRYVISGMMATITAGLVRAEQAFGQQVQNYGFLTMLSLVFVTLGLYNIAICRDRRSAIVSGAILAGGGFAMGSFFALVLRVPVQIESFALIPMTLGGALGGLILHRLVEQFRGRLGLKDPAQERQKMLHQLVELQDKLREGEQSVTFLSVDIVGSTSMKAGADPLNVEFTFNEYYNFVGRIVARFGGRVHSTAGDGMTCAFDHPQQAFLAARNIQSSVIELNTFRNKLGRPIVLRCGIHTGTVVAPKAGDITSVNFAHVIDVAAHVQKDCPPGGVAVSDAASCQLPGGWTSVGSEKRQVHETAFVVWMPRAKEVETGHRVTPPPAPMPSARPVR